MHYPVSVFKMTHDRKESRCMKTSKRKTNEIHCRSIKIVVKERYCTKKALSVPEQDVHVLDHITSKISTYSAFKRHD